VLPVHVNMATVTDMHPSNITLPPPANANSEQSLKYNVDGGLACQSEVCVSCC